MQQPTTMSQETLNRAFIITLGCSIALHYLLAVVIPNFHFDPITKDKPLSVDLVKIEPPPPPPPPEPEPPKAEPIKKPVQPKVRPEPLIKPIERIEHVAEATPPPPVNEVIAVEPAPESKPEFVAPAPIETPKIPDPPQVNLDDARNDYRGTLGRAIAKHKHYPKIATMRGWEGDVLLELKLDGEGNLLSANVIESSGYEALDKQAIDNAKKATPLPRPPEALRGRTFTITVPVSFKLQNN